MSSRFARMLGSGGGKGGACCGGGVIGPCAAFPAARCESPAKSFRLVPAPSMRVRPMETEFPARMNAPDSPASERGQPQVRGSNRHAPCAVAALVGEQPTLLCPVPFGDTDEPFVGHTEPDVQ